MGDAVDRNLWSRALDDDPEAFGEIFARHAKPVYNYMFRRCGDWSTAEDLTSIVFLDRSFRPV
jgi:DNA-directed RNA polymerase specialized sigma24 family protein